jgi:hypothetical protein
MYFIVSCRRRGGLAARRSGPCPAENPHANLPTRLRVLETGHFRGSPDLNAESLVPAIIA